MKREKNGLGKCENSCCDNAETPMMLVGILLRAFKNRIRKEEPNIPMSYRLILMYLSSEDGINQMQLVELTKLKAPTVSVTIRNMESDGYVKRIENEQDKRQVNVFLTEKGRQHDLKMKDIIGKLEQQAVAGFSKEETEEATVLLKKMIANLSDTNRNNDK